MATWPHPGHRSAAQAADPRLIGGDKGSVQSSTYGVLPIKCTVLYRKRDRNLDLVFLFVFKVLDSLLDSIEVVTLFCNL